MTGSIQNVVSFRPHGLVTPDNLPTGRVAYSEIEAPSPKSGEDAVRTPSLNRGQDIVVFAVGSFQPTIQSIGYKPLPEFHVRREAQLRELALPMKP